MFAFILQSLISLSLAGVLVYVALTNDYLNGKEQRQKALIGLCLGVTVISLSMIKIEVGPQRISMNAVTGPLLLAGYLGGPVGALIAGLCAVMFRVLSSDPMPAVTLYMLLAIPSLGLATSYLKGGRAWPQISRRALLTIWIGYCLLFVPPLLNNLYVSPTSSSLFQALKMTLIFGGNGTLSIVVTWQILNFAARLAEKVNGANELSESFELAMGMSGMGRFRREKGDPRPFFDEGMLAIYGLDNTGASEEGGKHGFVPVSGWDKLVLPEDQPEILSEVDRVWRGEQRFGRGEFRALRPDGSVRFIRAAWVSDSKNGEVPTRVTGVHMDLTDIREAEKQNRASQERLAMIAEEIPGVIMEIDMTDMKRPKPLYVSPKCKEIWGVSDREIYDRPEILFEMHDPEDIDHFLGLIETKGAEGKPFSHRYRITARDGSNRWLDFHCSFSKGADGEVLLRAVQLDATGQVEVQNQVQQEREIARRAQKFESIGQLTGGVAHDFNNLLAVVLGNLELLRDDEEPAKQVQLIDAAIAAALRGADLTKNMLAFARKAPLEPVKLNLNDVVREAKNWMGRALPESVQVETSLLAGLWAIDADRTSLESALLNLTLNARDAMNGKGNLTIETANVRIDDDYIDSREEELAPGRYVMLAISDTGPGIEKELLASIFEPFFTTKPPGVGSGLGLSMTLGFVRQSGGTVQVYSEIGEGTTFKLYFPASKDQPDTSVKAQPSKVSEARAGRRLLLAEDEEGVRDTLVTILERAGYLVTATASGDEAFATFVADPTYDLLLTDIVMPGKLQGTTLAKELRLRWTDLPVIFMSGYASEATVHGNGLRPEDIRLMKPVRRADLLAALDKATANLRDRPS